MEDEEMFVCRERERERKVMRREEKRGRRTAVGVSAIYGEEISFAFVFCPTTVDHQRR